MKLTINHLCGYLPYGLKMIHTTMHHRLAKLVGLDLLEGLITLEYTECIEGDKSEETSDIWSHGAENLGNNCKPLLRPLSSLTKTIEVDGEEFVPVERLKTEFDQFFNVPNSMWPSIETDLLTISDVTGNIPKTLQFSLTRMIPICIVEKLLSWHFDIHGLLDNNLALPIEE